MSQSLSRWQSALLGLVVVAALGLGGYGVARIAERQGLWADSFEVTAGFPEAHDVGPGTTVRIRGVDAGQVVAVEYPDHDGPGAEVTVRMKLQGRFAGRVYADATARVHGDSLVGSKVIAVDPGSPARGPLAGGRLKGLKTFGTEDAVAEVRRLADGVGQTAGEVRELAAEARGLVKEIRESNGTVMKLIKDDEIHKEVKELLARADRAVGTIEKQASGLGGFITEGRETLRSVKQGTDALSRLPVVRSYVEDVAAILVRPNQRREMWYYSTPDLFEPGTATLTHGGQVYLNNLANVLKENRDKNSEVVVAAYLDPADRSQTATSATELARKQAERVVDHLKYCEVHKLGTFARRKMTPLGMGHNPNPVVEQNPMPRAVVQVLMFTP